jgi:hypothetical protein
MLESGFRRGRHTAQSTIKAFSKLPHHTFQPRCAEAEDLEIVAEHLGHAKYRCDPGCLPRKLPGRASARGHRNCHSGMTVVMSEPRQGEVHAFLATPIKRKRGPSIADVASTPPKPTLPANVGKSRFCGEWDSVSLPDNPRPIILSTEVNSGKCSRIFAGFEDCWDSLPERAHPVIPVFLYAHSPPTSKMLAKSRSGFTRFHNQTWRQFRRLQIGRRFSALVGLVSVQHY